MEKRSRRRIRDLVAPAAFQGLSQNEIGCARISMMARSTNAPFKGRIQKRKTNHLQIITFGLQRTAGPYKGANTGLGRCDHLIDFAPHENTQRTKPSDFARDALGVSDDVALQELSGQRRSRDKDWPPRD
jgi:hypothetical protein